MKPQRRRRLWTENSWETHQGTFCDGSRYYAEHTSHHPPITHFLFEHPAKLWQLTGYYEFHASMGMNHAHTVLRGPNNIKFKDGTLIRYNTFEWNLHGTVRGERMIEVTNSMVFEDITNGIRALVCFNTTKKTSYFSWETTGRTDGIEGIIYVSKEKPPLTPTLFGPK